MTPRWQAETLEIRGYTRKLFRTKFFASRWARKQMKPRNGVLTAVVQRVGDAAFANVGGEVVEVNVEKRWPWQQPF